MAVFNDILKSYQLHQNIQKSMSISSQLSEITKTQGSFAKSLTGVSMISELAKSMQQQYKIFESPTLSAIKALSKKSNFQSQFSIPHTTFDTIASLNRQHEKLFNGLKAIPDFIKIQPTLIAQIKNMNFALTSISGQIAALASIRSKWSLIDDFEEITKEAVSLNERIFDENGVTKAGLNELKVFLQRIEIKVDKIDADANTLIWKLLSILGFILAILGEARNWAPNPDYVTKQDVENVIKEQFGIYEKKLEEDKEFRITRCICNVMLKPSKKSLIIENLPINFKLTVLQVNHKWVFVSYFNHKDKLPQTGWVLKKYLDKPNQYYK